MRLSPSTLRSQLRLAPLALTLSAALLGPAETQAADQASARAVIDRHLEAVGGAATVLDRHAVSFRGRFEVQGISGPFVLLRDDGRMKFRVDLEGFGSLSQGFDGTVGWEMGQSGPTLLDGARLESLELQTHPRNEVRDAKLYPTLERLADAEFEGKSMHKVRLVTASGDESIEFYDPDTGLRRGSVSTLETPAGPQEVTLVYDDYEEFDGLKVATTIVQRAAGQEIVRTIESVDFGAPSAADFEAPAEIRDLAGSR